MKRLILIISLAVCLWMPDHVWGQNAGDYSFSTGVDAAMWQTLTSAASTISELEGESDEGSSCRNIGFDFVFCGVSYSQFSCSTEGRMRLGSTPISYDWHYPFAEYSLDYPLLAPMASDLSMECSGTYVKYQLFGSAPHRVLAVEFRTEDGYENLRTRYQVQLHESTNRVVFVYHDTEEEADNMVSYQVGIASSSSDRLMVNPSNHTLTTSASYTSSDWPGQNRYYLFTPCPDAYHLAVDSISYSWASISWDDGELATSWTVELDTIPFVSGSCNGSTFTTNNTHHTFTGLADGKTYYCRVHAQCGSQTGNDRLLAFTTWAHAPEPFFYCGFEQAGNNGWIFYNDVNGNNWRIGSAMAASGQRGLYVSNDGGNTATYDGSRQQVSYAVHPVTIPHDCVATANYHYNCSTGDYADYVRLWLVPGDVDLTGGLLPDGSTTTGYSYGNTPEGWIDLYGESSLAQYDEWYFYLNCNMELTAGDYQLVVMWTNDGYMACPYSAGIDDISIAEMACAPASNLSCVSHPDLTTFRWTTTGHNYYWQLHVWNDNGYDTVAEVSHCYASIPDLQAGVTYYASVYTECYNSTTEGYAGEVISFVPEALPQYQVQLYSNNEAWGSVLGAGYYEEGTTATVEAVPADGYSFVCWSDGNQNSQYSFVVTHDITLIATFVATTRVQTAEGARFFLYPNPTEGSATVTLQGVAGQVKMSVVDVTGREVLNQTIEGDLHGCRTTIEGLSRGTYFVRILGQQVNTVQKLVVR